MGPNSPVPSRAAIHALRGLVFGTSCSVVLIAEERRRRLKTVRAAAENARKIHAAKAHRGVPSGDGLTAWEARLLHQHEETLTSGGDSPSPRNFRRTEPDKKRIRTRKQPIGDAAISRKPARSGGRSQGVDGGPNQRRPKRTREDSAASTPEDITSRVVGDGLSAWMDRLAGGDASMIGVSCVGDLSTAPTHKRVHLPSNMPHPSHFEASEVQRKLANPQTKLHTDKPSSGEDGRYYAFPLTTSVDLKHPESALAQMGNTVKPMGTSADSLGKDRGTVLDSSSTTSTLPRPQDTRGKETQHLRDESPVATAGDSVAGWEAHPSGQTGATSSRRVHTPRMVALVEESPPYALSLAQAEDGLAKWELRLQTVSQLPSTPEENVLVRTDPEGNKPKDFPDVKAHNNKSPRDPEPSADTQQGQVVPDDPEPLKFKTLFKVDKNGQSQPTFDVAKIEKVVPDLIYRLETLGINAKYSHRWLQSCLMLETLFSLHQAREDTTLVPHISSLMKTLDIICSKAPLALRNRPQEIALAFLQSTAKSVPFKLQDHTMLLLSNGTNKFEVLPKLIAWVVKNKHIEAFRQLVNLLQQSDMSSLWQNGFLLSYLLHLPANSSPSSQELVQSLRDVGFLKNDFSMAVSADLLDEKFNVDALLRVLSDTDKSASSQTQGTAVQPFVVRHAYQSSVNEVLTGIERNVRAADGEAWLRFWRDQLIRIFLETHHPTENETFLRGLHAIAPFAMKSAWVEGLLKHHSETGDLDKFLDWLRFSIRSGFRFDPESIAGLATLLSERWSVPSRVTKQVLADAKPALIYTTHRKDGITANVAEDEPTYKAIEEDRFNEMVQQCRNGNWPVVITIYDKYLAAGSPFSSRCLGLAVTACLNRDGPTSEAARAFVRHNHAEGYDVSNELRRLLSASLRQSSHPSKSLARMSNHGLNVTPEIYNIVARECINRGNPLEALRVCEQWATEHGQGKLGYDEYHFSTLLRIYRYLGSPPAYAALVQMISQFVAQRQWWHRSPICKESIKHNQKKLLRAKKLTKGRGQLNMINAAMASLDMALQHIAEQRALSGNPDWIAAEVVEILRSGHSATRSKRISQKKGSPKKETNISSLVAEGSILSSANPMAQESEVVSEAPSSANQMAISDDPEFDRRGDSEQPTTDTVEKQLRAGRLPVHGKGRSEDETGSRFVRASEGPYDADVPKRHWIVAGHREWETASSAA